MKGKNEAKILIFVFSCLDCYFNPVDVETYVKREIRPRLLYLFLSLSLFVFIFVLSGLG